VPILVDVTASDIRVQAAEALFDIAERVETLLAAKSFPNSRRAYAAEQVARCRAAADNPVPVYWQNKTRYERNLSMDDRHRFHAWTFTTDARFGDENTVTPDVWATYLAWVYRIVLTGELLILEAHGADHMTRFPQKAATVALQRRLRSLLADTAWPNLGQPAAG
jgi:hypothetical protein